MATSDTTASKTSESGQDGEGPRATPGDGARGTRRKLNDQQEREVTRLYAQTETPVSEISKRFGIGESSVYRVAQRHGAALRGRTGPSATSTSRAAAKSSGAGAGGGTRGRRGRGAAKTAVKSTAKTATKSTAKTASKSAAKSASKSASSSGNGRRTRTARVAGATPTRRTGGRAGAGTGTRTRGGRGAAGGAGRREFRVSYVAVRTFTAANMADAIRQAEAAGATDITGVERRA